MSGLWLPEPLLEDPAPGPASRAELADSLSLALLVLLERLSPVERAAYLAPAASSGGLDRACARQSRPVRRPGAERPGLSGGVGGIGRATARI